MSSLRRRRAAIVVALAAAVIALAVIVASVTGSGGPETAVVRRGRLEVTIETTGHLTPRDPLVVHSPASAQAKLVAVSVGDVVQAGDVLVQLDPKPFQDAIDKAEDALRSAETALNLAEQQGGSNPSPQQLADRLAAEQRVRDARQARDAARQALANSLILSPESGTVIDLKVADGAPVASGAPIAEVADLSKLDLVVNLDEIDLPHVVVGAHASFTLDAYPGQEIEGTIARIAPSADTTGGTTTFPATVRFTPPPDIALRPGMNADVSIQTAARENVLLVPERALRTVGRRTFVTVQVDGRQEEREIQTGLRSGGMVEVVSGLAEGERVVLH